MNWVHSSVGEHSELASISRADTANPNLMAKEMIIPERWSCLPQNTSSSLCQALLGRQQPSARGIQTHLITVSRPGPVQGVTDLSINWAGLQGFLQAASLIHLHSEHFFLFLLLTLVIWLFIFTAMPEAMSMYQNFNTRACTSSFFLDKHPICLTVTTSLLSSKYCSLCLLRSPE